MLGLCVRDLQTSPEKTNRIFMVYLQEHRNPISCRIWLDKESSSSIFRQSWKWKKKLDVLWTLMATRILYSSIGTTAAYSRNTDDAKFKFSRRDGVERKPNSHTHAPAGTHTHTCACEYTYIHARKYVFYWDMIISCFKLGYCPWDDFADHSNQPKKVAQFPLEVIAWCGV